MTGRDDEANRFSARATRYAKMGVNAGAFAAKVGVSRLSGGGGVDEAADPDHLQSLEGLLWRAGVLWIAILALLTVGAWAGD